MMNINMVRLYSFTTCERLPGRWMSDFGLLARRHIAIAKLVVSGKPIKDARITLHVDHSMSL